MEHGDTQLSRDYAALALARGTLDAKVAEWQRRLKQQSDAAGQTRLALLLRAKGDLTGAVAAAKRASDNVLMENLLLEAGQWAELVRRSGNTAPEALLRSPQDLEFVARLAMLHGWQAKRTPASGRSAPS